MGLYNTKLFLPPPLLPSPRPLSQLKQKRTEIIKIKKLRNGILAAYAVYPVHFNRPYLLSYSNSPTSNSSSPSDSRSCFGHLSSDLKPSPVFFTNVRIPGPQFLSRIISFVKTSGVKS
jgi:hypothetical protein